MSLYTRTKHPYKRPHTTSIISIQLAMRCSMRWQWQSVAPWVVYNVPCMVGGRSVPVSYRRASPSLCLAPARIPCTRIRTNFNLVATIPPGDLLQSGVVERSEGRSETCCPQQSVEDSTSRTILLWFSLYCISRMISAAAADHRHSVWSI